MTDKLLPCPFCGGKAELREYRILERWAVSCSKCEAMAEYFDFAEKDAKNKAIRAWQKRKKKAGS